ncbi:MAG: cytochrome c1 [Zetaproteobacteria bacterium CG06_land_8_20_14_3_00_59_53]|nr:MAG: cytochrome c1 [Zetaproteobacteria bacterium CG2_30_59_37]PIO90819.1 MAG: cytochrome c1 [Zetaproteobacteria bacterium CG23_combo_of_CG06-09_8_20_14_all_59_86]PIQ64706.1 MAG: cytochrome c1 [Zetaproteobacteria bacterium CG11_big_fil_rev_8_21_14_0_20_59_439]PIU71128.1 MAG: cytochrome c1 [Zetaproteobacteria bacterium CG06_land_8_20_14_3_00_59_53]PIU96622.1 MAG: cytochrome c1 [Zetaproteobacteria bacterium CG03_land_8_20_14_0_80_59_51]PIY46226.1 MAG: cytochrome c1 [Zetaproteobacteria bacteriu
MKFKHFLTVAGMALVLALPFAALANEGGAALKHAEVNTADRDQINRGLTVFTEVCMGCHSAKYVTYKSLIDYPEIGLTREAVDELRGDKPITSGLISDLSPEDATVSYGKVPPDLSLIVNARRGGANYVYSILTGFEKDPDGKIPDGTFNEYFPGHRIAMPDPLGWLDHDEADTAVLEAQAKDVAAFLTFIGDPHQNERHAIGKYVMIFLILLTIVLYLLKKEVWKDIKH